MSPIESHINKWRISRVHCTLGEKGRSLIVFCASMSKDDKMVEFHDKVKDRDLLLLQNDMQIYVGVSWVNCIIGGYVSIEFPSFLSRCDIDGVVCGSSLRRDSREFMY